MLYVGNGYLPEEGRENGENNDKYGMILNMDVRGTDNIQRNHSGIGIINYDSETDEWVDGFPLRNSEYNNIDGTEELLIGVDYSINIGKFCKP